MVVDGQGVAGGPGFDRVVAGHVETIGKIGRAAAVQRKLRRSLCDSSPIDKQLDELAIAGGGPEMLEADLQRHVAADG